MIATRRRLTLLELVVVGLLAALRAVVAAGQALAESGPVYALAVLHAAAVARADRRTRRERSDMDRFAQLAAVARLQDAADACDPGPAR